MKPSLTILASLCLLASAAQGQEAACAAGQRPRRSRR